MPGAPVAPVKPSAKTLCPLSSNIHSVFSLIDTVQ
nr:MAG TPA: hypothetical protein [Caudoviricetes sp.]